jgi:hypothetical protein
VSLSTTGVSGGSGAGGNGGGVAEAIVRAGDTFKRLDKTGYNDPNVPCTVTPNVRWVYGDAHPSGPHIYGWIPEHASSSRGPRKCPPQKPKPPTP